MRRFRTVAALVSLGLWFAVPPTASAQLTVFDPTNYVQTTLTAARSLQAITNQITSLANQAQMLINQGKALSSLNFSSLGVIVTDLTTISGLLQQANRISYSVGAVDAAFAQRYGASAATGSDAALVQNAQERWLDAVAGYQDALHVQAGVVGGQASTQGQISALVTASQGAVGALQATQAGNQLLAVQSKQLADLTALLASSARAQSLAQSAAAASQAQGQEQFTRFLTTGQGYQASSVSMFH